MTRPQPRSLVHRGHVHAVGLLLDAAMLGEEEARRRVLTAWTPGTRVHALGAAYVVLWAEGRSARVDDALGACLVQLPGVLSALPLLRRELAILEPPPYAVALARAGEATFEVLGEEVDPAAWVDVEGVAHESSRALVQPAPLAVRMVTQEASEETVERALRFVVGEVPANRAKVSDALAGAKKGDGASPPRSSADVARNVRALWTAFLGMVGALFGGVGPANASSAPPSHELAVQRAPIESPGRWTRVRRALHHLAAQALLRLRLARFVGEMHAEYLAKMVDMFDRGDLDGALRFAIPLAGEAGTDPQPALLPPKPRASLALTAGPTRGGSVFLVDDFYADLRRRYRAAFAKLDEAGHVEQAAFVLAELLRASAEAVAYLEKHRRFALAAELAEARGLAHDHVVRLWFRAGQVRRAIALAKRHGCFLLAVERLQREDAEAATALRLHWAEACASAGDYVGAARVAIDIQAARALVASWLEQAIGVGGTAAAAASVMKLDLDPGAFAEARDRMRAILEDRSAFSDAARLALLEELARSRSEAAKGLARAAVRAVARDGAVTPDLLSSLVQKAGDGALRIHALARSTVQRPTIPPPPEEADPRVHTRGAGDASGIAVRDAALVGHRRLLVALGELGVRIVSLDGRTIARFDVPASALVVSSHGDRALAVIPRGEALEVARIDVVRRRVQRWGLMTASAFARSFDGATWYVGRGREVLAIDATLEDFSSVWRTTIGAPEADAGVTHIEASSKRLVVVGQGAGPSPTLRFEVFELPSGVLRSRVVHPEPVGGLGAVVRADDQRWYEGLGESFFRLCAAPDELAQAHVDVTNVSWCVRGVLPEGKALTILGTHHERNVVEAAHCLLPPPTGARLGERNAVVFDGCGRVMVIDLRDGGIIGEAVVRL